MTFQYCFDGSIKKVNNLSVSSPRTWGCFLATFLEQKGMTVFPTHVGVFLLKRPPFMPFGGLPHARGGVSPVGVGCCEPSGSSPRTWGCFWASRFMPERVAVFPTHVGVFLGIPVHARESRGLPHARGGVSWTKAMSGYDVSVFPTHVGVFLIVVLETGLRSGLPHARGGVSP